MLNTAMADTATSDTNVIPTITYGDPAAEVAVDLDRLVTSRMLVQANSGGGKSWALRYLLEQTHGHIQQIVLDPEGEFASLREKFDYVLAGQDADVPATPQTAKVLCRRLLELGASAVIDLYDLQMDGRREFVRLFLEELMHLPRALWRPLLVIIDEAHVFCPERGSGEAQSKDAVIALCTQGRKRGFCAVLATQRISKLHKDAAAELLNKFIGRTGLDVDVSRAGDELGFDKKQRQDLKYLQPGQFFVYGPAVSREVTPVQMGAIQTTHPAPGQIAPPAPPPPEKIRSFIEQLKDLPQQAEEEARTIDELKEKLHLLQTAVNTAKANKGQPQVIEKEVIEKIVDKIVEVPVLSDEHAARLENAVHELVAMAKDQAQMADQLMNTATELRAEIAKAKPEPSIIESSMRLPATPTPRSAPSKADKSKADNRGTADGKSQGQNVNVKAGARRMLEVLAAHHPIRLTVAQLSTLARVKKTGGTFSTYFSTLKREALISVDGNEVSITLLGLDYLGAKRPEPATSEEIIEMYRSILKAGARRMLDILVGRYPAWMSDDELSEKAEIERSGGTWSTYLSMLQRNGLIESNGKMRRANPTLFLAGQ